MRTSSVFLSALVVCACEVPSKNAGEVEGATSGDAGGTAASTGDSGDSGGSSGGGESTTVDASYALDANLNVQQLLATEDGIVAVVAGAAPTSETSPVSVVGLTFDLQPTWNVDLGAAGIRNVAPLDGGGVLVTGFVDPSGMSTAAAWKLSCCGHLDAMQTYDNAGGPGLLAAGEPIAGGFALARLDGQFTSTVLWVDDELALTNTSDSLSLMVQDASVGSDGQVVLVGIESVPGPAVYDDGSGGFDGTHDLLVAEDGTASHLIFQNGDTTVATAVLQYADDGTVLTADPIHLPFFANKLALTTGTDVLLAGQEGVADPEGDIRVALLDASWNEQWAAYHDGPGVQNGDIAHGVAHDGMDRVLVAGSEWTDDAQDDAWIGAFSPDGSPLWSDSYGNELMLGDGWRDVAADSQGDVIAVGYESVLGQQTNALVRKYHPL